MRSEENSLFRSVKLLVVCLRSDLSKIRQIISGHTALDWEKSGEIKLLPVADHLRRDCFKQVRHRIVEKGLLEKIEALVPPTMPIRVIVVGHINEHFQNRQSNLRIFHKVPTNKEFNNILPLILEAASLNWKTLISNHLQHYSSPPQIDAWLKQFELLGKGWVGQALLQLLDFWPDHRICEALFEPSNHPTYSKIRDWLDAYDLVVYSDPSRGKSSAVVARYIKGKWGVHDKIQSLPNALKLPKEKRHILYFEDCIMTGTECMELVKKSGLENILETSTIDFKFAVGTQYGLSRLETFIRRKNIQNKICIIRPTIGYINNLTENGLQAFKADRLFNSDYEVDNREKYIISGINLNGAKHFNSTQRDQLIFFCRDIGRQLMFRDFIAKDWDANVANEKANDNCFGFGNLGLLIAFAHALPDNLIPLFRLGGEVNYDGKSIEWVPLFRPL